MKKISLLSVVLVVLAVVVVPASAMVSEVTVTAGTLAGIGDDGTLPPFDVYSWGFAAYDRSGDGRLDLLLDLGDVTDVKMFEIVNRTDEESTGSIASVDIYVASTEGDAGFDPAVFSNYDTQVDVGYLLPGTIAPLATRTQDIVDSMNRYFVIQITGAYWGAPSPAFFSDILTSDVPEPATMCMLGFGGLLAIRRRRA